MKWVNGKYEGRGYGGEKGMRTAVCEGNWRREKIKYVEERDDRGKMRRANDGRAVRTWSLCALSITSRLPEPLPPFCTQPGEIHSERTNAISYSRSLHKLHNYKEK